MRENAPYQSVALSVVVVALMSALYLYSTRVAALPVLLDGAASAESFLGNILREIEVESPRIIRVVAVILMVFGVILTTRLTLHNNLYGRVSYLPTTLYLTTMSLLATPGELLAPQLISLLMIVALGELYEGYNKIDSADKFFSGCFYIGLMPLIYPATLPLLLLLVATTIIFERSGREILITLVALFLPCFIQLYVRWLCGVGFAQQFSEFGATLASRGGFWSSDALTLLYLIPMVILSITAVTRIESLSIAQVARKKILFAVVAIVLALGMVAIPNFEAHQFAVVCAPLSISVPSMLFTLRSRWATLIYLGVIICALLLRVLP